MSFEMTLTDEFKGLLAGLGMRDDDIEACMSSVIQTLNQEDDNFMRYGGSPDIWQRPALEVDLRTNISIFNTNVLPAVVRWLAHQKNTQTDVLQEIHRLSSPAPEQARAE
jgi:hypothetical protein